MIRITHPIPSRLSTLLLFAVISGMSTANAQTLNLADTYQLATKNDPQWASIKHNYEANQEAKTQARAGLLPSLSLSAQTAKESIDSDNGDSDHNVNGYSASLLQPLFQLDRWYSLKKANAFIRQIDSQFKADQQAFFVRILSTYLDVLRAEETLRFQKAEESAIKRQLEQTEQRFKVGIIASTDVQESQAAYDISVVQRIVAERDLDLAIQNLETLTRVPVDGVAVLSDKAPIAPPQPNNIEEWVSTALDNSQLIKAAHYAEVAADHEHKIQRSGHLPTINIEGTFQDSNSNNDTFFGGDSQTETIGLRLDMPLYAGGAIRSKSRQAKLLYFQAQDDHLFTRLNTTKNTSNLFRVVTTDVSRVFAQKQSIASADSALKATEAGYEAGTRTVVDILDAQKTLFGAKRDYANARFDYIFNSLRLKQSAGILTDEDLLAVNQWLTFEDRALSN